MLDCDLIVSWFQGLVLTPLVSYLVVRVRVAVYLVCEFWIFVCQYLPLLVSVLKPYFHSVSTSSSEELQYLISETYRFVRSNIILVLFGAGLSSGRVDLLGTVFVSQSSMGSLLTNLLL